MTSPVSARLTLAAAKPPGDPMVLPAPIPTDSCSDPQKRHQMRSEEIIARVADGIPIPERGDLTRAHRAAHPQPQSPNRRRTEPSDTYSIASAATIKVEPLMPFAHPVYVRCIMDCLNSLGVKPPTVLANAGLAWRNFCDGQHTMDFHDFRQFVKHAIRSSGEPALGLIAGSMLQPYHSPVGIGAVSAASLGQSLQFANRHASLIFRSLQFDQEIGPQRCIVTVKPIRPLCETVVFVTQSIVAMYCRLLEAILGRPIDELSVGLPYSRPAGNDEPCLRYIRNVKFDQTHLSLELPAALLDLPSVSADKEALLLATQACLRMESELKQGAFVQRVRNALLEGLTKSLDVVTVATDLGVPVRTLARRLAEAGVTYSDLKDELRRTHAVWYLQHTELSIEAIASQLGYADTAIFSRKFKCWYRIPPTKLRQTLRRNSNWNSES
jgi:AraC-like DNA-binding protein